MDKKKKSPAEQDVRFVVFLDVDGVLNSRTSCARAPSEMYTGVDHLRIEVLAKAMQLNRVDGVVLTSTWKDLEQDHEDYIYLTDNLRKYGIKVLGKTEDESFFRREDGILKYLEEHPGIEEFIILDDQHFGFDDHTCLWENYLDTQGIGIEHAIAASKTPTVTAILFLDGIKRYS